MKKKKTKTTQPKQFKCPYCNSAFVREYHLIRHINEQRCTVKREYDIKKRERIRRKRKRIKRNGKTFSRKITKKRIKKRKEIDEG